MKPLLVQLVRHAAWANERTLASLRGIPEPPPRAVRALAHVVAAERIYLERVRGDDPFPQDFWPAWSLDDIAAFAAESARRLPAFVDQCDADALRRSVRYRDSRGGGHDTPIYAMLLQVALHGEHHRGQIADLVRAAGGVPAITDLIVFVREHPDARRG